MTIYITKDGEILDYIVGKHYGKTAGILEQVLNANRHLAEYDAVLPAGVKINLPELTAPASKQKIKMWQ
jgi:phage tail protein X